MFGAVDRGRNAFALVSVIVASCPSHPTLVGWGFCLRCTSLSRRKVDL